jgi:hypothetical protein
LETALFSSVDMLLLLSLGEPLPGGSLALVHDATRAMRARTSENANCPQFTILHRNGTHEVSERTNVFSDADPAPVVAADRPTLGIFAAFACYR